MDQICYVVPSLSRSESQHFAHLPGLLREIGRIVETYVIIERSNDLSHLEGVRETLVLRARNPIGRMAQIAVAAIRFRRKGCRRFFVRISPLTAFILALLQRPLGLTVYYWISGEAATKLPASLQRGLHLRARLSQAVTRWLQFQAVHRARWFVTGPERMRDYFVREYKVEPSRVIVLYNAIDLSKYAAWRNMRTLSQARQSLRLPADRPIVLFVGRISYLKGGGYLPIIARSLAKQCPEALLVGVGGLHLPAVLSEVRAFANVRLVGAVPQEQVLDYYRASNVLILPSVSEGFPHVLLEAMALGLPIVAFDVGGVRDIVGPTNQEWIVDRGDVAGLVGHVVNLLGRPDVRKRIQQEGFRIVRRFDAPAIAEMFVDRICRSN